MAIPGGWTWVHWKVLELACDQVSIPDLLAEHTYAPGLGHPQASIIPASSLEETRGAVLDLVEVEAIRMIDKNYRAVSEVEAVLADPSIWADPPSRYYEVVEQDPVAATLLESRPGSANPHKPVS